LAVWGGDERESFLAMVKPFEERTGVKVEYEGTRDLNAVLTTRVQGGNPPTVAALPGPDQMAEFARRGALVSLDRVLNPNSLRQHYAQAWLDLGSVDGKLYAVFVKTALKGMIWYSAPAFKKAGYTIPKSWDELMALTDKIAKSGTTPWCIGLESGAASGWPATDWIENLLIRSAGPRIYDRWVDHQIPWTHPAVKGAWQMFGKIATNPKYVLGGAQGELSTNFGQAPFPLFSDPPRCYLHHQAIFIQDFIHKQFPSLRPRDDFNFFMMPAATPTNAGAAIAAGDTMGMFKDTPQARALIQWLITPEAQAIWVRRGGALSPNRKVSLDSYPDPLSRQAGRILTSASTVRFDGSDLMPEAVNSAFWKGTLEYVRNPGALDGILENLDRVARAAYKKKP
jgi:alpha-glucoside transport system substrate-binding protein